MITTDKLDHIIVDDNNIEMVDTFIFLGVLITINGVTDKELRRRLLIGKYAMGNLKCIFNDRGIYLMTTIMIVQILVFSIILYGAETWTIKKADRTIIDAFELWCWRKLFVVTYLDRNRNTEIIDIVQPKRTLESRIVKAALYFFGHVVRSAMMELQMILGRMEGRLGKGRPHWTWLDNITKYLSKNITNLRLDARDRAGWRIATKDVERGRFRLDGTR